MSSNGWGIGLISIEFTVGDGSFTERTPVILTSSGCALLEFISYCNFSILLSFSSRVEYCRPWQVFPSRLIQEGAVNVSFLVSSSFRSKGSEGVTGWEVSFWAIRWISFSVTVKVSMVGINFLGSPSTNKVCVGSLESVVVIINVRECILSSWALVDWDTSGHKFFQPSVVPSSFENEDDDHDVQDTSTDKDETENLSTSESSNETLVDASAALEGNSGVGVNSNSHTNVTGHNGCDGSSKEGKSGIWEVGWSKWH